MINENWIYSAWLSKQCGPGSAAPKRLYNALGTAKDIYNCTDFSGIQLTDNQKQNLLNKDLKNAEYSVNVAINIGFKIITYDNVTYPQKLKKISNPPCIIYYRGAFPAFDDYYSVGIVGTRKATINALDAANGMAEYLGSKGVLVISGLATGIDRESHIGAVNGGGFTAGISGVKAGKIYPQRNKEIYDELYKNGVVISEFAPDSDDRKSNFPIRNRIITGLSDALLIVEAPEKSGALITAEKAISENRPVFVYPGDYQANQGGRLLIAKGAIPVIHAAEILDFFEEINFKKKFYPVFKPSEPSDYIFLKMKEAGHSYTVWKKAFPPSDRTAKSNSVLAESGADNISPSKENKQSLESDIISLSGQNKQSLESDNISLSEQNKQILESYSATENQTVPQGLTPTEEAVYKYIMKNKDASTDLLIADLELPSGDILSSASLLEIYGYIKRLPGDKWCIL